MIGTQVAPSRVQRAPAAVACLGLAIVVVGTFLPWLRSGSAVRNSYAGDAVLRRLVDERGLQLVFAGWPYLGLTCAAAAGLLIIGRRRTGAALAAITAAAAGTAAVAALAADSSSVVAAAVPGPAVTAAGAAVTLLVALFLIVRGRTP